jgi:hypothetical protein
MRNQNYKKKVEKINQFNIDFDECQFDDGLQDAVKEFNKRANQLA